jgi:hypothetical protein
MNNASNYHNGKVVWNGAVWVAAGNGGVNSLLFSEDGINWFSGGTNIFDSTYGSFDVAWNGSIWVAVGAPASNRELVAYSLTGRSWTTVSMTNNILKSKNNAVYNTNKPVSIEWDGYVFVITLNDSVSAGNHNYIVSYDGINWDHTQGTIIFSANIAKWTGCNFVIAGEDPVNSLLVKQNGGYADWHLSHNLINTTFYDIEANTEFPNIIVFPRTLLLAGKNHSYDATTWFDSSSNIGAIFTTMADAATDGKRWVAVGSGTQNTIAYSRDGLTWFGGGANIFTGSAKKIAVHGRWVAVGSGTNSLAYSNDGIYWTGLGTAFFTDGLALAVNQAGRWFAGGSTGSAYSDDGATWTAVALTGVNTVIWNKDIWLAASNTDLYTSQNGVIWNRNYALSGYPITGLGSFENTVVAMSNGIVYISTLDLGVWSSHSFGNSDPITGFAQIRTEFLFSSGTYIYWTADFNTWTTTTLSAIAPSISINNSSNGTAIVKPIIVACADSTYNTLGYSYDGVQWYGCGNTVLQTRANHAAWNGSIWVAVGLSTSTWFAVSRDGIHWQQQADSTFTEGQQIAWNGSLWVAVGEGTNYSIATSVDGILWAGIIGSKSLFSTRGTAVAWTGGQWVAYGSPAAIATSTDGITWTISNGPNSNGPNVVGDLSSVLLSGASFSASASSGTASNAFDMSSNTLWTSSSGVYNGSGYTGSANLGGISGEWLQIAFLAPITVKNYSVCGQVNNQFPSAWTLIGSTDAITWATIDIQDLSMAVPTLTPSLIFSTTNTIAYQYYGIVFRKTVGGSSISINSHDLFLNNPTQALSKYHRILNTKNYTATTVSTGYSTLIYYRGLPAGQLNGQTLNTGITDPNTKFSSYSYNGQYSLITDFSNSSVYYNTDFSQNQLSSVLLPSTIGDKHTSCYNGTFFFVGGSGTTRILYAHESDLTTWYSTANADAIFVGGSVLSLVTNPQIGFVVSPNTIHLIPGDKLSISAPRFYDENVANRDATFTVSLI